MVADKRALKQMLLNLLSNALKFTANGGSVVASAQTAGGYIDISVEDTGVGIAASDLPRVGDPFFQARGSYDRPYEGTGLGLSIVKGLVELHHGELKIESEVGKGTRITLHLPLDCENQGRDGSLVVLPEPLRTDTSANGAIVHFETHVRKRA
jgi:cell cycle sensor histidine kinase DivJ